MGRWDEKLRSIQRVAILVLTLAGLACSSTAPTIKQYEKDGVQFAYFSDWKVTGDAPIEDNPGARSIDLEGPNSAFVTFIFLPSSTEYTLEEFASSMAAPRANAIEHELSVGPVNLAKVSKRTSQATTGRVGGARTDWHIAAVQYQSLGS